MYAAVVRSAASRASVSFVPAASAYAITIVAVDMTGLSATEGFTILHQ